nr:chemotaxis protein CheW [Anaerolineales bacterium]
VVDLIFAPGLSTAETLTDISGRGVGMDVVRANLEQLRGVIQVDTQPDKGTTFRLFLPLTLTTSHVLLVRAGGETVALPVMNVERLLRVAAGAVGDVDGRPVLTAAGRVLPFVDLARLLELPAVSAPVTPAERLAVVVLNVAGRRLAVRVDELLAEQEVVLKSLGRQLRRVRNVAGATVLGDGQLVAVLNPADLLKSALAGAAALSALTVSAPAPAARRRILLADDSITTRTMEKHILEAAGYIVIAAADGREAWEAIRQAETPPDLVVSDVDMPHMTGLALTEALKADARLARIPVVLVTSQDAPAERLRGLNAGADAYLVKTAFDQRLLVETVGRLIG